MKEKSSCDDMWFYHLVLGSSGLSGATRCHLQGPGKAPQIHGLLKKKKEKKECHFYQTLFSYFLIQAMELNWES